MLEERSADSKGPREEADQGKGSVSHDALGLREHCCGLGEVLLLLMLPGVDLTDYIQI